MGGPTPFSNLVYRLDLPVCWEQLSHTYLPITIDIKKKIWGFADASTRGEVVPKLLKTLS
jgi:hypothetical protein